MSRIGKSMEYKVDCWLLRLGGEKGGNRGDGKP